MAEETKATVVVVEEPKPVVPSYKDQLKSIIMRDMWVQNDLYLWLTGHMSAGRLLGITTINSGDLKELITWAISQHRVVK